MSTVLYALFWAVSLVPLGLMAWLIYLAIQREHQLDQRLLTCDTTLLTESGYIIERVTLGPAGSHIIENAQVVYQSVPQYISSPPQQ